MLIAFDRKIQANSDTDEIKRLIKDASDAGVPELAIDGELIAGARQRLSVQSLLNILDVSSLDSLFKEARQHNVRLSYRYQIDSESAARTIWTGLHASRTYGFTAGKYGLLPLTLEEQRRVVELISGWTKGWTAIPAFYVGTGARGEGCGRALSPLGRVPSLGG